MATESEKLRAHHVRLSILYGTPAAERVSIAVAIRQELRAMKPPLSERHHAGIIAAIMQLHRNAVYRYLKIADANPDKYTVTK